MKALMLVEYGRFEVTDVPEPEIAADEVLVRVKACGICGSDVHGYHGATGRRIPPIVMGHEASGYIVAVGAEATEWKPGDRVTFDSTIYCGACDYCKRGQVNLCDNRRVLGVSCGEYRRQGAFADLVAVPARVLCRLPSNLDYARAAMVEPVSVAVHGVKRAQIGSGDRVVVVGAGMIGLLVIQVAKQAGAAEVIAVDIDSRKRQMALELGASSALETADGLEVDVAIEAVGIDATVGMAMKSVRKGGRVSLVGNLAPEVEMPLQVVVTREITVYGCCASQGDYPESLDLIASGKVRVDTMISERIGLEQAPEYFDRLNRNDPALMKVMVCP